MRVLVTGGCGFIGSAFCRHVVTDLGWTVLNVDKLTYAANPANVMDLDPARHRLVELDINDRPGVAKALVEFAPDAIAHLAAESHVDRSITGSAAFIETNILGTYNLLEAARQYVDGIPARQAAAFRFLHISTDEVFGSLGEEGLFSEKSPYDPRSPYSASKAASDHLVNAWGETYGLPVMVTNCSNNYGPRHFPEKLIPLIILNALEGKPLPVYGDGQNIRDWLYVDDHARGLAAALVRGKPGEKYNFGGRAERRNLDVVTTVCGILDELIPTDRPRRELITFVQDRPGHDRRYAVDSQKAERELGWSQSVTFEDGLRQTVRWYLDNEAWWRPIREGVYDGGRLGLAKS